MLELPAVVRAKAAAFGAGAWVDRLPELVGALAADWGLELGRVFGDATEALVAEAVLTDGTAAVLKLHVPRDDDAPGREIRVLRAAGGDGCVRLLRADPSRGALLLERLGRSLHDLGIAQPDCDDVLCDTARRVWRPAPGLGLPTGAEHARWLAAAVPRLWEETGRPCTALAVEHAVACAERREAAHDDARAVLVHGDVHPWNCLEAPGGFALVDPDGLLAEPELDLGVVLREDPVETLAGGPEARARRLAARSGRDVAAIWEWGVAERVSTGLLATKVDMQPGGRLMLAAADEIARRAPFTSR